MTTNPTTNPTDTTGTTTATIDRWLVTYTETDGTARRAGIEALWNPEGRLIEPPLDGTGHDGIDQLAQTLQGAYAGNAFRRVTAVDEHHQTARYGWEMVAPDGSVALRGLDVVRLDDKGRLLEVVGFFGEVPAPA